MRGLRLLLLGAVALLALGYVLERPWLLWAAPLVLVGLLVLLIAVAIVVQTHKEGPMREKQRKITDEGVDRFVRSRLLDMGQREAPPPDS